MDPVSIRPVVALVALLPPAFAQQTPDPELSLGKQVEQHLAKLGDDKRAPRAAAALERIGRPAVSRILRAALQNGRPARSKVGKRALQLLGRMGPDAGDAFDDLADVLGLCKGEVYLEVLDVLGDLAPYSLHQDKPHFMERLVLGSRDRLEQFTRGNDRQKFQYRLNRLQQRNQVNPRAGLSAMIEELERNRTHRREVAAEVVGRMGKAATKAVPALVQAMSKKAPVIGQIGGFRVPKYRDEFPFAASDALIRIAPGDPRAAIAWGWRLEHSRLPRERATAAMRLGSFGEKSKEQIDLLVDALRDRDSRVQQEAATALGMIGPIAKRAKFRLRKLTESDDKAVAARAKAALRLIEKLP